MKRKSEIYYFEMAIKTIIAAIFGFELGLLVMEPAGRKAVCVVVSLVIVIFTMSRYKYPEESEL